MLPLEVEVEVEDEVEVASEELAVLLEAASPEPDDPLELEPFEVLDVDPFDALVVDPLETLDVDPLDQAELVEPLAVPVCEELTPTPTLTE